MGACCSKGIEARVDAVEEDHDPTGGLAEMYEVKHLLGSGSAGDTWLCREKETGELLAVKLMKRPIPPLMGTNIMREVKIGAQLGKGHLNLVKPRELILTRTHLGIVMEYVAGGNMADYILKTILLKFGSFDTRDGLVMEEDEARYFFMQIINAVDYCHKNKVAHRDLKMDNTLLDDDDPPRIKLCDFGFAKWWTQEPQMTTITGTPDYMSPQLLGPKATNNKALYDGTKADIWAAGVMLCVMLIGRFPFEGIEMSSATNLEEVSAHVWHQQNQQHWYDNPLIAQDCSMLSAECIDLLNRMFHLDESKRITIPEIRQHPWYRRPLPAMYAQAMAAINKEQARIDQQVRQQEQQQRQQLLQDQQQQQQQQEPQLRRGSREFRPGSKDFARQVASGAFVNKDRDAALKRMIYLAASRYSPEQEDPLLMANAGGFGPSNGGTDAAGFSARGTPSMLRKISLTAIKPYEYEDAGGHVDLAVISNFFKQNQPDQKDGHLSSEPSVPEEQQLQGAAAAAAAAAVGQQQQPNNAHQHVAMQQQQQQQQHEGVQQPHMAAVQQPQQHHQQQPAGLQQVQQQQQQQQPFDGQPLQHSQPQHQQPAGIAAVAAGASNAAGSGHNYHPPVSVSEIYVQEDRENTQPPRLVPAGEYQ